MISVVSSSATGAASDTDRSSFLQKMFARIDSDGDGTITEEEFTTAMQKRHGESGQSNGTATTAAADAFAKADTDGDGKITQSEFSTAMEAMRPQGQPPPPPPKDDSQGGDSLVSKLFAQLDSDSDGGVTLDELTSALTENKDKTSTGDSTVATSTSQATSSQVEGLFKLLDTDEDGVISSSEFSTLMQQLLQGGAQLQNGMSTYTASGASLSGDSTGVSLSTQA